MFEKQAYLNFLEDAFPGIKANVVRCETLGYAWESRPFLKEEKGEILSHVGLLEYPMVIEGRRCSVGVLHAICTKVTHRNQGLASELIQEALQWAKNSYEFVTLFTKIPAFYEKFSFHNIQEYRFHLACQCPKGTQTLKPVISPKDNPLLLQAFHERAPVSNQLWIRDNGTIAPFNTLFATYPTYWSLYYSPSINGIVSYLMQDKTLHLFDIVADKIPTLDLILDHLPAAIDEIYFYFSPDRLTDAAIPEPYIHENEYLMAHGNWPKVKPFMISPISRC